MGIVWGSFHVSTTHETHETGDASSDQLSKSRYSSCRKCRDEGRMDSSKVTWCFEYGKKKQIETTCQSNHPKTFLSIKVKVLELVLKKLPCCWLKNLEPQTTAASVFVAEINRNYLMACRQGSRVQKVETRASTHTHTKHHKTT